MYQVEPDPLSRPHYVCEYITSPSELARFFSLGVQYVLELDCETANLNLSF